MSKFMWIGGRKYYYYDTFSSWNEAYRTARWQRKKNKKCRYFIQKVESGFIAPTDKFRLYLTHTIRLSFW